MRPPWYEIAYRALGRFRISAFWGVKVSVSGKGVTRPSKVVMLVAEREGCITPKLTGAACRRPVKRLVISMPTTAPDRIKK